jgi:dihydropyrimidinase
VTKNKISMNRFVEITSTAPAKIFGMYGKKGTLAVGADADVVVWDPNRAKTLGVKTLHMRIDYSPFEGRTVPGSPSHVFSRGDLIVKDDQWVGKTKKGRGQFVRRGTFNL